MRVSIGFIVKNPSDAVAEHFKRIGYQMKQLPIAKAVGVEHPMRTVSPLQFYIATFKAYPAMYQLIEDNREKYVKMLEGQKGVCLEVYNYSLSKINFYMPMEHAKEFYLTKMP